MDQVFLFYRDPLFGIIIFVAIIATIAFLDYSHNRYLMYKKEKSLTNLANSYKNEDLNEDIVSLVKAYPKSLESWMLLGKTYSQSGDSQSAIGIYLSVFEAIRDPEDRLLVLRSLAKCYLNAGFFKRARDILQEILRVYARDVDALRLLMEVYEKMGEYKEALETLECLEEVEFQKRNRKDFFELDAQQREFRYWSERSYAYFSFRILLEARDVSLSEKIARIWDIKNAQPSHSPHSFPFNRSILMFFKTHDLPSFWEYFKSVEDPENYIDILYSIPEEDVPEDIREYPRICEVFFARGFMDFPGVCSVFELEALRLLRESKKAYLAFEYRCRNCKDLFPFFSMRCESCADIGDMDLVIKVLEGR